MKKIMPDKDRQMLNITNSNLMIIMGENLLNYYEFSNFVNNFNYV